MDLPYSNATSGQKALTDIEKILREFGCTKFATGSDWSEGSVFVQFEHRGRMIQLKASAHGYANAWLKKNPWSSQRRCSLAQHESKALDKGNIAIYSILRDWIKGQVTAIECEVMSFEEAFLSHIMLPSGQRLIEVVREREMLPKPEAQQ